MEKKYLFVFLTAFLLFGCTQNTSSIDTYDQGMTEFKSLLDRYGADLMKSPTDPKAIPSLEADLLAFQRKIRSSEDTKPLSLLVSFKIDLLASDRLLIEGFKWGAASTTDSGFGCSKGGERITNSSMLRNSSAEFGFMASQSLSEFVETYPAKAKELGISTLTAATLEANYVIIREQAQKDLRILDSFCNKGKSSEEAREDALATH